MNENQPEEPAPYTNIAAIHADSQGPEKQPVSGMEINVGDFARTQGLMKSLQLLLNNQIAVQVEDVASGLSDAGRKFKMGDLEQANQDVTRLYAAFGQRTNQWESQARGLEQQMKMQAAKNPKSISIDKMNQMKSEQTAVRTRIRTAEVQFRRLHQGLDQAFTNFKSQPGPATSAVPLGLPDGFLMSFKAAAHTDRPKRVRECFDIETVLQVNVSKGTKGGYDIKFDPMPPLNRFYFLTKTAQIIRLQQLSNIALLLDLENGDDFEMKLVEFVKHVQCGVCLLSPRVSGR
jgi:hypothetical protein